MKIKPTIKHTLLLIATTFFLCACDTSPSNRTHTAQDSDKKTLENTFPRDGLYGSLTKNTTSLPIQDIAYYVDHTQNKLHVLFSPATLTDNERSTFISGKPMIAAFHTKQTPHSNTWQWFPYATLTLLFKSSDITADNIKSYTLMMHGMETRTHRDNLNNTPNETQRFTQVNLSDNKLTLHAEGKNNASNALFYWTFHINP